MAREDFLASLLTGLTGGFTQQLQAKQEQRNKLAQILAAARAQEQAKAEFDPETQAKRQALAAIMEIVPTPRPRGGYNRVEQEAGIPGQVEGRASQNRLQALQQFGLLPRPQKSLEDIFLESQARSEGSASTAEARAEAGERGRQRVKYEDLVKQFNFISEDVDSVLGFLEKVPAGRAKGPGAAVGAFFGMEGSENVLQYTRTKDLILSKIAKTFGGEVGVLTEGDIKRISRGFPALWMNDREREVATQWVKDYIQRRIEEYRQPTSSTLSGQTSRFQEGQTATNPRTGETLTYRNGQWQ